MLTYFIENRRQDIISLNQPHCVSVGIAANGIRAHFCTSWRHTLALRLRQSLNARRLCNVRQIDMLDIKLILLV